MDLNKFHRNILDDVKTELADEFDRNFERKAFFDKRWTNNVLINRRGSMMARTNNLRRSLASRIASDRISFSSSLPYASLQNEGGEIVVTKKMKSYFWAKFYEATGGLKHNKNGELSKHKGNLALSVEAQQFKALALQPVGKKIKIPERRFIGQHPRIKEIVEQSVDRNLQELNNVIMENLRQ